MARTELPNGVILPVEYSDDWYEDMTSNLTKLDDVIGSDSEKLNADGVYFLRMSSAALTDSGTGNFSDLNSSYKIKTGDLVLDSGRKLYQIVSVDSANSTFSVGNSLFKVTAESDLAPVAESGDYDDLDNKPDLNPYDQHLANTYIHVTSADKQKWNDNVSQSYVLRYASTAVTPSSTIAYSVLNNTDNVKAGDSIIDSAGKVFLIVSVDNVNETVTVGAVLLTLALDANVMHLSGNESASGNKNFQGLLTTIPDSTLWPSNTNTTDDITYLSFNAIHIEQKSAGELTDLSAGSWNVVELGAGCFFFRINNGTDIRYKHLWQNTVNRIPVVSGANRFINDVTPETNNTYGLGDSTRRWKTINNINPGSLSMPDLDNGIDISGFITLNSDSSYTPLSDGYIYICCYSSVACGLWVRDSNNHGVSTQSIGSVPTYNNLVSICIPVVKNVSLSIFSPGCENILTAKFYPCQGNV